MDEPYIEKHGPFLLKCVPARGVDGTFFPRLVATRLDRHGDEVIEVSLPMSRAFPTVGSAAEFALTFGKRWVRERMLPPI